MREAMLSEKSPVLLDRFLNDAVGVGRGLHCRRRRHHDRRRIMEHIEQARACAAGDSACSLPPYTLSAELQDELRRQTALMAKALRTW